MTSDLHLFLKMKHGDFESTRESLQFIPYQDQRQFADGWWKLHYKPYHDMGWFFHDGFLYDALIDATNVYNRYYRDMHGGGADYVMWQDADLQQIVKQSTSKS